MLHAHIVWTKERTAAELEITFTRIRKNWRVGHFSYCYLHSEKKNIVQHIESNSVVFADYITKLPPFSSALI